MKTLLLAVLAGLAGAATVTASAPQPESAPIALARNLYAAARYDDALELLNALRDGTTDRKAVEQYRSLCLLALGRVDEAADAIAAVVMADPAYKPDEADASPRVRAAFAEVRRRLLPDIAAERYASARTAYERRDWVAATDSLQLVVSLLDDTDMSGRLPDLRLLAAGFLELVTHLSAPPPSATGEGCPVTAGDSASAPPPPATTDPSRVYGAEDSRVTPPVTLRQELPKVPIAIAGATTARGLLEVVIDARGRVVGLSIRQSMHPAYDRLVLSAAQEWKYEPARLDGEPVQYRKLIQMTASR